MILGIIIGLFIGFVFGFFLHGLLVHADDRDLQEKKKMNFKKLKKELPVLLGWNIHCSEKIFEITSFVDLRTNDEAFCLASMSPNGYDYDSCLLIWGENEDLIIKKMKEVLEIGLQNGMLINSATLLSQEEISKCIDYLRRGYIVV